MVLLREDYSGGGLFVCKDFSGLRCANDFGLQGRTELTWLQLTVFGLASVASRCLSDLPGTLLAWI